MPAPVFSPSLSSKIDYLLWQKKGEEGRRVSLITVRHERNPTSNCASESVFLSVPVYPCPELVAVSSSSSSPPPLPLSFRFISLSRPCCIYTLISHLTQTCNNTFRQIQSLLYNFSQIEQKKLCILPAAILARRGCPWPTR